MNILRIKKPGDLNKQVLDIANMHDRMRDTGGRYFFIKYRKLSKKYILFIF